MLNITFPRLAPDTAPLLSSPEPTPRPAKRKKKGRRRWLYILLFLIITGVTLQAIFGGGEKVTTIQTTKVEIVANLASIVSAPGTVEAKESVDIQTEIAGVILEIPVKEGDWVKRGQILVKIDPFQTQADLQAMQAQLAATVADAKGKEVQIAQAQALIAKDVAYQKAAEADLAQAQTKLELSESQCKRIKELFNKGIETEDSLDSAASAVKVNRAQVAAVAARVTQYEVQVKATVLSIEQLKSAHEASRQRSKAAAANMSRAQDSLKKTTIYAPLDGLITHLNVEKGERAVPGILSNPQATLMTIADMSLLEARIGVDETDIIAVDMKNAVEIIVDALPDQPLKGVITEIGNAPVAATTGGQEGRDFLVKVRLIKPPSRLRPGMSCEGEITTAERKEIPVVPIQALTRREVKVDKEGKYIPPQMGQDGKPLPPPTTGVEDKGDEKELEGVFCLTADKRARFQPVHTGITGEMDIEITDVELKGSEIIIGPFKALRKLKEGDKVMVKNDQFKRFARKRQK